MDLNNPDQEVTMAKLDLLLVSNSGPAEANRYVIQI
jgi:hypothetical protein